MAHKTLQFVLVFLFYLTISSVKAQVLITKNDTIGITEDMVYLKLDKYIGEIQWEKSDDGIKWIEILDEKKDSISISTETNSFYRAKVTVNNCDSFYSDTTQFKIGEIIPLKTDVFSQEICYLKLENIKPIDTVYYADFNGKKVKLFLANKNYLTFLIPELNESTYQMNLSVNNRNYEFNFLVRTLPLIEDPLKYYNDLLDSTQTFIDKFKSTMDSMASETPDIFKEGDFDLFAHYFDSLLIDLRNNSSELSEKDLKFISVFLSANPGFFNYPDYNANESNLKSGTVAEYIPEKGMENLAKNIFFNANQLDLIANNLGTNTSKKVGDNNRIDKYIDLFLNELYDKAGKVSSSITSIFNAYGNSMAVLRITETVNMVRNKVYIQDGRLVPVNIEDLDFKSNISSGFQFTSLYRNLIIDDQVKFVALKAALDDFNEAYNAALSTFFISNIDFIAESIGIINIGAQFPLICRTSPSIFRTYSVKTEYIVSQEADIKASITNLKVNLTGFSKDTEVPLILKFENLTDVKQEFSFNVNYEHKGYSKSTTSLSATVLPAKYKLGYSNPYNGSITNEVITFANPESKLLILLNDPDGSTATGIDYSKISVANNTNSNVIIGLTPIIGTYGSFYLDLKTNQTTNQTTSFDVLYNSKKVQTINAEIISDLLEYYKSIVPGAWTMQSYSCPTIECDVLSETSKYQFFAGGTGIWESWTQNWPPYTPNVVNQNITWNVTKQGDQYILSFTTGATGPISINNMSYSVTNVYKWVVFKN